MPTGPCPSPGSLQLQRPHTCGNSHTGCHRSDDSSTRGGGGAGDGGDGGPGCGRRRGRHSWARAQGNGLKSFLRWRVEAVTLTVDQLVLRGAGHLQSGRSAGTVSHSRGG